MEDLDNIKAMWTQLNERLEALESENRMLARKVMNEKFNSARERLIRKYNIFIIIEIIMIFYALVFIFLNPLVVEKYKLITGIYWVVFFLFEISIDTYLKQRVKDIDIYNSSVSEISSMAAKNWKIHKLAIIIGLPLAIGAIVLFALALNADEFTVLGMIIGGVIGFLIGLSQLRNFLQQYRLLQTTKE